MVKFILSGFNTFQPRSVRVSMTPTRACATYIRVHVEPERVPVSAAGGLNNLLLSDSGAETRRCTYAESYLERPPRSCQLLLCAEVSCLLGS